MQKLGEEYSQKSAEARHHERLGLGNFGSGPYSSDFGYRLEADGIATRISDNSTLEIHVTLHASPWKSAGSMVSMDIMNGTIEVGDETYTLQSGDAHYLTHVRQLRILAFAAEGGNGESFQVLVLKAKAHAGTLPFPDSTEPLQIEVLGPQSRLLPGFTIEMSGVVELTSAVSKATEKSIVLNAILDHLGNDEIFHDLISAALQKLRQNHPDLDIRVVENTLPYPNEKTALIDSLGNGTSVDLFSADQIWLGELADRGLLTDLTNFTDSWGRSSDWYQTNWDGGAYKGKTYGIWVWTDVRGIYYWKDLLNEAGVDPESLRTWSGYLEGAQRLNAELRPRGIEGVHLTGVGHSPDLWYPYLWMLGGEILEPRSGNPVHGDYWYPAYNSSAGVEALGFIRDQVQAGIIPQQTHDWGQEFADRKFAVMIEASHVPSYFDELSVEQLDDQVGYLPLFPVPNATTQTATLMGGWELTIPVTSQHKELTWELVTLMVEPEVLSPWLAKYNYLPTQLPIGQDPYAQELRATNPFFDEMATLIQYGHGRPSIPEYPQIAEHIREAIDDVYYGRKDPKQALDDAAAKSAEALGWT
jgi:multiple sugar transport system substrate-binding protein